MQIGLRRGGILRLRRGVALGFESLNSLARLQRLDGGETLQWAVVDQDVLKSSPLERMLQQQIVERGIKDPRLLDAMRQFPRELFFPDEVRHQAYADGSAPIGHGQTISQPYIVALMTNRLDVRETDRVLELGTGSGYQTAILAKLAKEVFTIERVKPLLDAAFERLSGLGIRNVRYKYGDGTLGWPEMAGQGGATGFDRIVITAGAPQIPDALLRGQLADGGIAVLPVGATEDQMLVEVHRHGDDFAVTNICPCRFVKLIGAEGWKSDEIV
jgi:protein-L-isoaspartate(D-aspartate) O-methyltransferase